VVGKIDQGGSADPGHNRQAREAGAHARLEISGHRRYKGGAAETVVGAAVLEIYGQAVGACLGEPLGEGEAVGGGEGDDGEGKVGAATGNPGGGHTPATNEKGACAVISDLQRQAGEEEEAGNLARLTVGGAPEILIERARCPGLEADALGLGLDIDDEGKETRRPGAGGQPGGGAVKQAIGFLGGHGRRIVTVGRRKPSRSCTTVRRSGRKPARR